MKRLFALVLSIALLIGLVVPGTVAAAAVKDGTYTVESTGMYPGLKLNVIFSNG